MRKITFIRMFNILLLGSIFFSLCSFSESGKVSSKTSAPVSAKRSSVSSNACIKIVSDLQEHASFSITVNAPSLSSCYIDLNGNKQKDDGESFELDSFGDGNSLIWGKKKEVFIYGDGITKLKIPNAKITSIDVTKAQNLTWLDLSDNLLTSLDISSNPSLVWLDCCKNAQLKSIKMRQNNPLTDVHLAKCGLEKIDLKECSQLNYLVLQDNSLIDLDLSKATNMTYLSIAGNQIGAQAMHNLIQSLNSKDPEVGDSKTFIVMHTNTNGTIKEKNVCLKKDVAIATEKKWSTFDYDFEPYEGTEEGNETPYENPYEKIAITPTAATPNLFKANVSGEELWIDLNRDGNKGSDESLTAGENTIKTPSGLEPFYILGKKITSLEINECAISALDLSLASSITAIICQKNSTLTNITLPKEKQALVKIDLSENALTGTLDLSDYPKLTSIAVPSNKIAAFILGDKPALKSLNAGSNMLISLDLLYAANLEQLSVPNNKLTDLSFASTSLLKEVEAQNNQLTNINLTRCEYIENINFENNQLEKAFFPVDCSMAKMVNLSHNKLTTLDLGAFTAATEINVAHNELETVIAPSSKALRQLTLSHNALTQLNLSGVPELQHLYISKNKFSRLNLAPVKNLLTLSIYGNQFKDGLMTQLVEQLPTAGDAALSDRVVIAVYIQEDGTIEKNTNTMTTKDVEKAIERGWNVCSMNYEGMTTPYKGEPIAIQELIKEKMEIATLEYGWKLSFKEVALQKAKVYSLAGELLFEVAGAGELTITTPAKEVLVAIEGIDRVIPLIR